MDALVGLLILAAAFTIIEREIKMRYHTNRLYKTSKLPAPLSPAIQTDDGPKLDGVQTTLYPGSAFIVSFGLAYGRVVITYPVNGSPTVTVEQGPDLPKVTTEFERVKLAEVLGRGEGQGTE